jgi:hypothetical protein
MAASLPVQSLAISRGYRQGCSLLTATWCVLNRLPLFFAARPRTPLRVFCIMALETASSLRRSGRLSAVRIRTLSLLLDYGAQMNAALDGKSVCPEDSRKLRSRLCEANLTHAADEYFRRIQQLELNRPAAFGDRTQCEQTRVYREDVARLSLGIISQHSFEYATLDDGLRATQMDNDLSVLFRIIMQCQIIDDVFDYSRDVDRGLPGFLTASNDLFDSFETMSDAAKQYSNAGTAAGDPDLFAFRTTLFAVSAIARIMITLGRWRQGIPYTRRVPEHVFGP